MGRTTFTCQQCGYQSPKWLGKCPACSAWGALVEEVGASVTAAAAAPLGDRPRPLATVAIGETARQPTGVGELDRVLGGGLVRGSLILIGGDPGIGKSTLALQAAYRMSARGARVLYVAGEESAEQVKMRAARIVDAAAGSTMQQASPRQPASEGGADPWIIAETAVDPLLRAVAGLRPEVVVVDSVQALSTADLASAAGSVGQVREVAARLVTMCKASGIAAFLIGHVTKEGFLAGPRVLEHMVDTVLYFEGDRGNAYRILRAAKNRFGSTNEIGVFEMQAGGLVGVPNASEIFLAERPVMVPGSAVIATIEGSRPILVEVQALVTPTSFGTPRRTTLGLDPSRAALLAAVLEKQIGLRLLDRDLFLNVVGGVRIEEPAADLGVVAAIASSYLDRPLSPDVLVMGEIGLAGEVRAIGRAEMRVREGASLGYRHSIVPAANARRLDVPGAGIVGVRSLQEFWAAAFGEGARSARSLRD